MAATTTTTTITVKLPQDVQRDLAALAHRTGRTEAEIVLEAVERHLRTQSRPMPKSMGMISDAGFSAADYEEWLKANWRPEEDWGRE